MRRKLSAPAWRFPRRMTLKHWHGAGPTTTMSHMAITEVKDGAFVTWMEKVADDQYKATPG